MWARIDDTGRAAEFTAADPAGRYHPQVQWAPVPEPLRGWADTSYVAAPAGAVAPPSLDHIKEQAKARAAERRWRAEVAGARLPDGTMVPTRDRDKTLLGGARERGWEEVTDAIQASLAAGGTEEDGRAAGFAITHTLDLGGRPVTATNGQFIAMARAQAAHVQACFDRWGEIWRRIDAATTWQEVVEVYEAEIDQGWPGAA